MARRKVKRAVSDGPVRSETFWSLAAFADDVAGHGECADNGYMPEEWKSATFEDAVNLARGGWTNELDAALELAESAVTLAEKEHMTDSFNQPVWDVTGAQVDVGAYLMGTPECMIDYPLSVTSKAGRVITLCASVIYSGSLSAETVIKRGRVITALALALSRLGHNVELWADLTGKNGKGELQVRVLVKGADDELDPAKVMYAFAHPSMLRQLHFSALEKRGYRPSQRVLPPKRDLPEGTIYLPELVSGRDVPDADEFLRKYLGELGLLAE
jgi:hypothetical protein